MERVNLRHLDPVHATLPDNTNKASLQIAARRFIDNGITTERKISTIIRKPRKSAIVDGPRLLESNCPTFFRASRKEIVYP